MLSFDIEARTSSFNFLHVNPFAKVATVQLLPCSQKRAQYNDSVAFVESRSKRRLPGVAGYPLCA